MSQDKQDRRNLTVRLTPMQWRRVRDLALDLDVTVQDMLVAGLNRIFTEQNLQPLNPTLCLPPPHPELLAKVNAKHKQPKAKIEIID